MGGKLLETETRVKSFILSRLSGLSWLAADQLMRIEGQVSDDPLFALGGKILSFGSAAIVLVGDDAMRFIAGPSIIIGCGLYTASGCINGDGAKFVYGMVNQVASLAFFYGEDIKKLAHLLPNTKLPDFDFGRIKSLFANARPVEKLKKCLAKIDAPLGGALVYDLTNSAMGWEAIKLLRHFAAAGNPKDIISAGLLASGIGAYICGNHMGVTRQRLLNTEPEPMTARDMIGINEARPSPMALIPANGWV